MGIATRPEPWAIETSAIISSMEFMKATGLAHDFSIVLNTHLNVDYLTRYWNFVESEQFQEEGLTDFPAEEILRDMQSFFALVNTHPGHAIRVATSGMKKLNIYVPKREKIEGKNIGWVMFTHEELPNRVFVMYENNADESGAIDGRCKMAVLLHDDDFNLTNLYDWLSDSDNIGTCLNQRFTRGAGYKKGFELSCNHIPPANLNV